MSSVLTKKEPQIDMIPPKWTLEKVKTLEVLLCLEKQSILKNKN